ncbi:MAG: hypothetical protein SGARI_003367 [Bacillariaceae sp.]
MASSQLMSLIVATYQRHQMTIQEREAQRIQREQEQELRRSQDAEYQETLRADQERERQRKEARETQERLEREENDKEQKKIQEEQDRLDKARALVRPEPTTTVKGETTRIRFQLPTGKKLERRFYNDETVGALKAFLILHFSETSSKDNKEDHVIKNISLSTNFPKKTYDDDNNTLQESDLCPQAVLMCQDLDA